ncbi:ABC transporter ATP-binding protein [Roseomonas sp. E05]|uniref:ABC transporter ATP-binding protein n=1 Tax=Roseomonas sp. E05 TaxID=3046310 RepID=UPI0024B89C3F|nr:ABC transporter ATP-binding protein [Roseomonas sp. E05]MDJ0389600.1 ABC transporter ATP-binding protein [Roseomonas sp. E05]
MACPARPHPEMAAETVLEVRNLSVRFRSPAGPVPAVSEVSFSVRRGETLALVGESGSGKSVTSLALLRLTPPAPACRIEGQVLLRDRDARVLDVLALPDEAMRQVRGPAAAMVFQEPMTSFNPVHTIGDQVAEAIRYHAGLGRRAAFDRAAELLDLVGIPEPRKRLSAYPHQLSGGMRQRAMIAMALSCEPGLLIADEPTTALDVTIQAQILDLLRRLQQRTGMAMIFITHNLGVVAEIADRVMVMYSGRVVEQAAVGPLFAAPRMPYTMGLLESVPRIDLAGRRRGPLPAIPGNVPDPLDPPPGCAFEPRCAHRVPGRCNAAPPALEAAGPEHRVRCLRWREIATRIAPMGVVP